MKVRALSKYEITSLTNEASRIYYDELRKARNLLFFGEITTPEYVVFVDTLACAHGKWLRALGVRK